MLFEGCQHHDQTGSTRLLTGDGVCREGTCHDVGPSNFEFVGFGTGPTQRIIRERLYLLSKYWLEENGAVHSPLFPSLSLCWTLAIDITMKRSLRPLSSASDFIFLRLLVDSTKCAHDKETLESHQPYRHNPQLGADWLLARATLWPLFLNHPSLRRLNHRRSIAHYTLSSEPHE